jgi:hypothetical protein
MRSIVGALAGLGLVTSASAQQMTKTRGSKSSGLPPHTWRTGTNTTPPV